ncbi:helix-turn-helix transcriptional regulator [Acidobacteriota bacterium]
MKKIRFYRLLCEKTQAELANEIKCTQPLISMFESGRLIPGKDLRQAIANSLHKKEDEIFPLEFCEKCCEDIE